MHLPPNSDPQTKALPYVVAFLLIFGLLFTAFYLAVASSHPMH